MALGGSDRDSFLAKPQFDALSLRQFRRETLLQYANTNQSEPLRILLTALTALVAATAPFLAASLDLEMDGAGTAAAAATTLGSAGLFLRERGNRLRKLERLEREYAAGDLRLSTTAVSLPFGGAGKQLTLRSLRGRRVVAVFGSKSEVLRLVEEALPYWRRFGQSGTVVIPAFRDAEDGTLELSDVEAMANVEGLRALPSWLGRPIEPSAWSAYFRALLRGKDAGWFALSPRGRSVASGAGSDLVWDELLGDKLPPNEQLFPTDSGMRERVDGGAVTASEEGVLAAQAAFYEALTGGDLAAMRAVLADGEDGRDEAVSEILRLGGRLDPWDFCLEGDNAPRSLVIGNGDCVVTAEDTAVSTCIEFPTGRTGLSMLATQRWRRDEDGRWRLRSHRTIPFSYQQSAGGLLRCDNRGCAALTKGGA